MGARGKDRCKTRAALPGSSTGQQDARPVYSVYSVYRMEDRVGGRGGAGGEAEAAGSSTERRGMTREERKLVAAVEISQKLEKDRQRKQDQASKGKEAAGKRLAADEAARVSNSSTRKRRRGEETDAAGAGAAKKKKPLGVCVKTSSLDMPFDIRPGPKRCDDFDWGL